MAWLNTWNNRSCR